MRQLIKTLCLTFFSISLLSPSADNLPQRPIITAQNVHLLEQVAQFEQGSLREAIWTPDGQYIFVTGSTGLWRFNPDNLEEAPMHFEQYSGPVTFSPDNHTAASLDSDGNIILWDFESGEFRDVFYDTSLRFIWITDLAFSPDGNQLAMGFHIGNMGWTGAVTVWDMNTRETLIDTQRVINDPVYIDYSSDGTRLMAGGYGGIAAWDTITWETLPMPYGSYIANIEYSSNANRIAYWDGRNQAVGLFSLDEPYSRSCTSLNSDIVRYFGGDIAFHPTNNDLLAVSQSGILALWDVASCKLLTMVPVTMGDLAFSPDGVQLVGVEGSGIHIYSADSLEELISVSGFVGRIYNMAFSDNSDLFAYSLANNYQTANSIRVWNTNSLSEVTRITFETNLGELENPFLRDSVEQRSWTLEMEADTWYTELYLRPSSTACKIEERQNNIDIVKSNTQSETLLQNIWNTHAYPVVWLCVSPDQRTLVTADQYSVPGNATSGGIQTVRVWDIISGELLTTLSQIPQRITFNDMGFSTGGRIFFVSQSNQVTIWDTTNWEPVAQMEQEDIHSGLFTFEEDMLITQNHDVTFWNIQTGTAIHTIDGLGINDLLISPNGALLALRRSNNTIELWGIPENYP